MNSCCLSTIVMIGEVYCGSASVVLAGGVALLVVAN